MGKFSGEIGFAVTKETTPGVWTETIVEKHYYGDTIKNTRMLDGNNVNSDINISNRISIVADPFAQLNFHAIRYVCYMGNKWKVSSIDVEYPRLILSLGGLYNGQQT